MLNTYLKEESVNGMSQWKTYVAVEELHLDPVNPREISDIKRKDLDYFIDKYELLAPLLIDGREEKQGQLLGGNNRLDRLMAKGRTEVWIEIRHPQNDAEAFEIATISNMQFATYVKQLVVDLTRKHAETMDISRLSVPLAPETNMRDLLNKVNSKNNQDDPPGVDTQNAPKSFLGGLYQLGNNRVLCGDATKLTDMQALMGDKKADMIFTDPPYNVAYEGKTKEKLTIKNDVQSRNEFYDFLFATYVAMFEYSKAGASIYVCHADSERVNFTQSFEDAGWKLAQVIIWCKQQFVMGRQDYQWQHEPILYGWKEGEAHYFDGGRAQTTLWTLDRPTASVEHPTMKPLSLITRALANSSKGEDLVLDPFLGSGSTLIACEQQGRICYGMELDPRYVDVIRKRYAKMIGQADWEAATPLVAIQYGPQTPGPIEGLIPLLEDGADVGVTGEE